MEDEKREAESDQSRAAETTVRQRWYDPQQFGCNSLSTDYNCYK